MNRPVDREESAVAAHSLNPFRRRRASVDETVSAHYDGGMHAVRELAAELTAARERGSTVAERRLLHARIDNELARAIAAASAIHRHLFEAAGGMHHAETDPQVALWKRRLQEALTVRSQHQLAEFDDVGVVVASTAPPRTLAAYGPHQAGMDFEPPLRESAPGTPHRG
jgi:hypothetical protein